MKDYGVVAAEMWTHPTFRSLSDKAKLFALYLAAGPHVTMIGCYRLPEAYASEDTGIPTKTIPQLFDEVFRNGFVIRDEGSKWLLVLPFLLWNKLQNPNVGIAALKLFNQVPDHLPFKPELARLLVDLQPHFPADKIAHWRTVHKPLANGLRTVSEPSLKPYRNQEQYQVQEQSKIQAKEGIFQDRALTPAREANGSDEAIDERGAA